MRILGLASALGVGGLGAAHLGKLGGRLRCLALLEVVGVMHAVQRGSKLLICLRDRVCLVARLFDVAGFYFIFVINLHSNRLELILWRVFGKKLVLRDRGQ